MELAEQVCDAQAARGYVCGVHLPPSISLSLSLSLSFSLGLGVSERAAQLGNRFRLTLSPIPYPYTVKPGKVNYVASVLSTEGGGGEKGGQTNEVQTTKL